ncbi:MAG: YifB family Mg chelatase-like AAA ATPase, partial [Planctomycetes bacterium]|nr:YifB family Mg chelatase-like AAA ATPase [Planctomycetota bacterium]
MSATEGQLEAPATLSAPDHITRSNGMIVKVKSAAVHGVDALPIEVEVDGSGGTGNLQIVGLPDKAVNEAKERVRTAICNAGYDFPHQRLTVNLAPADIKKEGPSFDLPMAVGFLAVSHQVDPDAACRYAMVGELALDGRVRAVSGVLPIVLELKRRRYRGIIVPEANAVEAGVVEGIEVYPVSHLREVVGLLNGTYIQEPYVTEISTYMMGDERPSVPDFRDVQGQESVKRAVVVAAAGGHNILMLGNPGVGKSMIARRIPGILPEMTIEEALETTKVYSTSGKLSKDAPLVCQRPFRSSHHTISDVGLIGGGATPRPGEVSHAHNGVLFLDELPEFSRKTLEVMRQPLEDGFATITRASGSYRFPARFMLVAAMNPCPCG